MANSKSDLNRDVGKLEGSVGLLTKLSFAIISLLGLVVAGGMTIFVQISNIKTDLALAAKDIAAANEKLVKIDGEVSGVRRGQLTLTEVLARVERRVLNSAPDPGGSLIEARLGPVFVADEEMFIRDYIKKTTGLKPMVKTGYKVGDVIPSDRLIDFPTELMRKIPRLKSAKYTVDEKERIIIVSAESNRVIALLGG